jgi:glycerol-3-phosphate dehydrogenase (NAD(P)+)
MKNILIIGAGAMGSAFSFPCLDNKHKVTLCEPYSSSLIKEILSKKKFHPALKLNLPKKLIVKKYSNGLLEKKWDLIVIAVSSMGIEFVGEMLKKMKNKNPILILTKGLHYHTVGKKILTMSEQLNRFIKKGNISVLKGPCLAIELANKIKTSAVIANKDIAKAKAIGKLISTNYYKFDYSKDVKGVEICSAIKNLYSMIIGSSAGLNTASVLFRNSILEMVYLTKFFKGKEETVFGLAGLGDLYVSALGGRNSKMGKHLGEGFTYNKAKKKFMPNDTIEGAQLAFNIAPYILKKINNRKIPLMVNLLKAICENKKLEINW